jgi:hypothetical protein
MVSAVTLRAKLCGLLVEWSINASVNTDIDRMSRDELERLEREIGATIVATNPQSCAH